MRFKEDLVCLGIFVILWTLIISVFYVSTVAAQTAQQPTLVDSRFITQPPTFQLAEPMSVNSSTIPSGAFLTPLRVGDVAQMDGILYSMEANAWILSEFDRLQNYWILEMNTRVNLVMAWAQHEFASQQNRHSASTQILQVQLDSRERDIETLREINRDLVRANSRTIRRNKFKLVFTFIGAGVVVGLVGYGVGRIQ